MALTIKPAQSCITWTDYQQHMVNTYHRVYKSQLYSDCRLVVADGELRASRLILAMASAFFESIFSAAITQPSVATDPLTILIPDLSIATARLIFVFIHTGEVQLSHHDISSFMDGCNLLQIRGVQCDRGRVVGIKFAESHEDTLEDSVIEADGQEPTLYLSDDDGEAHVIEHESDTEENNKTLASDLHLESEATGTDEEMYYNLLKDVMVNEEIEQFPHGQVEGLSDNRADPYAVLASGKSSSKDISLKLAKRQNSATNDARLIQTINADNNGRENYGLSAAQHSVVGRKMIIVSQPREPAASTDMDEAQELTMSDEQQEVAALSTEEQAITNPKPSEKQQASSYGSRLDAAIDAVLNQGVSYRAASLKYNIAKTVLWRKTMKLPRTATVPKMACSRQEAIAALKSGEKLLNVSRRFEIPLSTLHRDKLKLYSSGVLPVEVTLKQRDKGEQYDQRVAEATNECIAGRMSLSEAARMYGLPKTSIWRKVRNSGKNLKTNRCKLDRNGPSRQNVDNKNCGGEENAEPCGDEPVWRAEISLPTCATVGNVEDMDGTELAHIKMVHITPGYD